MTELMEIAREKGWTIDTKPDGTVYVVGEEVIVTDAWNLENQLKELLERPIDEEEIFFK